jgi:hypothetical protein
MRIGYEINVPLDMCIAWDVCEASNKKKDNTAEAVIAGC